VIELLNDRFVNVWTVIEELERLKRDGRGELHDFAASLLADYQYPVDTQIRSADGRLLRQVATNDLIGASMTEAYLAFLSAAPTE